MSAPGPDGRGGPGTDGVAVAIVTDTSEVHRGRVGLRYPWLEGGSDDYRARIAVPMAGAGRGTYVPPEEGDEVLVAFAGGDVDHPYVIGALWNGEDETPASADEGDDVRRIVTTEGHEVTFDDRADGGITIETAAGHSITLADESGGETITIEDTGGNEIEFDGTGRALTISSAGTLTIEAPAVELSSDGNLDIDAGGVLTLTGAMINLN